MSTEELAKMLEDAIDKEGLAAVLDMLAETCSLKAQHIEENWQDPDMAYMWHSAASVIITAQDKIRQYGI